MKAKIMILGTLNEATINKEKAIIENVALLSSTSANNREYTEDCLRGSVKLLEGAKCYTDHDKTGATRGVRDLVGRYEGVRYEDNKVKGNLHLLNDGGEVSKKILAIVEQMPDLVGNSISARGRYHRSDGRDIVEELTKVNSIDIVTDPATTSSLFESIEEIKEEKKEEEMDLSKLTLNELKIARPDIHEEILKEGKDSRNTEVKDLKVKVDDFEVKEAITVKKENVQKILKEAKIDETLVTETFLETLNEAKDDEMIKKIIEDRKSVAKETKAGVKHYGTDKVEDLKEDRKGEIDDNELESAILS